MAKKSSRAKAKAEPAVVRTDAEVRDDLLGLVRKLEAPATVAAILKGQAKALGRPQAELAGLLQTLHASGAIHRYGTAKTPKYYQEPPEAIVGRSIVAAASGVGPMSWAELKKRPVLKPDVKLVSASALNAIRDDLVRAGRIHRWPKLGTKGVERFSTAPPDPSEYLGPLLDRFREQLKALAETFGSDRVTVDRLERAAGRVLLKLGETAQEFEVSGGPATPPPIDDGQQILDAMRQADPATSTGAPIALDRLRPLMNGRLGSKSAFDEAVLDLARRGLVSLHRHDFPKGQTEAERDRMVPDGQGGFYVTISRRKPT